MSILGLAGLASGVDTNALVDQLMAIERQSTTRLQYRQAAVNGQRDALKQVASKLAALKDAALALSASATWAQSQTVESSDPTRVAVALTGGAGIGGHTIQVDRLASSMQRGYEFDATAGGTITVGASSLTVAAGATLQSVADAINAKSDMPVVAAIVKNGSGEDRLVLSSRTTGSGSDFTVTADGVLTEDLAYQSDPTKLDALYSLDGAASVSSQTNVLENAIPGLRITLKAVTASAATVTVGEPAIDRAAVKGKVTAFVNAYNAVVDTTRAMLAEQAVANPSSDFQAARGQLQGDIGLHGMLSGLRQQMTEIVSGAGIDDLGDLGITVPKATGGESTDAAKAGRLVIDDAKLTQALEADWTAVKGFFEAFDDEVETFVKGQTGGTGVIDRRLEGSDRTVSRIQAQIDAMNERLDMKAERMRAQFAAMEMAIQNSQSQQAWLTGQLAALQRPQ
ncbi:MAG: flagellar filament capping protein FliD [Solirubrobacteraceae bacterium]